MKSVWVKVSVLIISILGLVGCSTSNSTSFADMEKSKEEVEDLVNSKEFYDVEDLVEEAFPFVNEKRKGDYELELYVTNNFTLREVQFLLEDNVKTLEVGKMVEGKQVLVYPDKFVILKEEGSSVYIEVAEKEFVERYYSPSFFNNVLAYKVLNDTFGTSNWQRGGSSCVSGNCYGGTSVFKKSSSSGSKSMRGSSTRGGGPGSGK